MSKLTCTEDYGSPGLIASQVYDYPSTRRAAINALVEYIHNNNIGAGWWLDPDFGDLKEGPISKYAASTKLALVHSELSEALEGLRKDTFDDHLPHRKAVEVELADAVIRIFDLAGALDLDLGGAFIEKDAYNAKRADHKPENRNAEGGKKF